MLRLHKFLIGLLSVVLTAGVLVVANPIAASADVNPGPAANNPLVKAPVIRKALPRKINAAIDGAQPGSLISIASWNMRNAYTVKALLNAQRRGVKINLIMDRINSSLANPKRVNNKANPTGIVRNPYFPRLLKGLRKGNVNLPPERQSSAMLCSSSCRGSIGIAHSKFFLFSATGTQTNVVMYGSANLTDLAATNQWNDIYTVVNNPEVYNLFLEIFQQMWNDWPMSAPFVRKQIANIEYNFGPMVGPGAPNNIVLEDLNRVQCQGAGPGRGNGSGVTRIRVAITAQVGDMGDAIANKLHQLYDQGCDVKIIYAVFGNSVLATYRRGGPRGGVPIQQVVRDLNHDGIYDYYLHTKVMTIDGNYNGDPNAMVTINGSSNWTSVGLRDSDDVYARIFGDSVAMDFYTNFINYWFSNAPKSWSRRTKKQTNVNRFGRGAVGPALGTLVNGVNPYRNIEIY